MRVARAFKSSPALVVACVALLVSLTGTGIAAVEQLVPRNSVGTAQLKKGAVTSAKIKNKTLRRSDFKANQFPRGLRGPVGPPGPAGPPGPTGAGGGVVAYALIDDDGTLVAEQSSGVTSSMLTSPNVGVYCLRTLPAGARTIMAIPSNRPLTVANSDRVATADMSITASPRYAGCARTDRVRVIVRDLSTGQPTDSFVYIWFED